LNFNVRRYIEGGLAMLDITRGRWLPIQHPQRSVYARGGDDDDVDMEGEGVWAGAYTRSLLSSTYAVLITPPRVPLSTRLGEDHAPNLSHKMCLR
jgi:hypothetical protein